MTPDILSNEWVDLFFSKQANYKKKADDIHLKVKQLTPEQQSEFSALIHKKVRKRANPDTQDAAPDPIPTVHA